MNSWNETLERAIGALAEARPGNLASLAHVLELLERLSEAAPSGQVALRETVQAACATLNAMIMEEIQDAPAALAALSRQLQALRHGMESQAPPESPPAGTGGETSPGLEGSAEPPAPEPGLLAEFLSQHQGELDTLEAHLLALEREPRGEHAQAALRRLHSLKGDAGFLGLNGIARLCHAAESHLEHPAGNLDADALLAANDWLHQALTALAGREAPPAAPEDLLSRLSPAADAALPPSGTPAPGAPAGAHPDTAGPSPAATRAGESEAWAAATEGKAPSASVDPELLAMFASDARELIEQANGHLLAMEGGTPKPEMVDALFRVFHTLKGTAGFVNLTEVQNLAHQAENLLERVRRNELPLSEELLDLFFQVTDALERMTAAARQAVESGQAPPPDAAASELLGAIASAAAGRAPPSKPVEPSGLRLGELLVDSGAISPERLSAALREQGETAQGRRLGEQLMRARQVPAKEVATALRRQKAFRESGQAPPSGTDTIRVNVSRLEALVNAIGELVIAESMVQQDLALRGAPDALKRKLHTLATITREMQTLGTAIRMVPVRGLFQKMARLVRDLSHKSGKPAEFRGEGEDTEMDRRYVDLVHDPLVHLIRNAVDHGIEPEAERLRLGKPAQGSVVLRAYHEGGQIRIELEDDGRGLQRQAILEKALRMGLIDSAEGLTDQEAFALIFQPGFSTAKQVTEISGRGVGMDVVRRNIQSIRGDIALESEPGQGTRIRLSLPLTLALIDGLVVKVGEERFIFPVHAVLESIRPAPGDVSTVAGQGELLALRDGQVPLFRLGTLFHVREAASDPTRGMVIVAECGGRRYGLLVDHVLGLQQTVIKALGQGLRPVEGISGGTILGDGGVGLIVDVHALVQGARRPPAQVHSA